MFLCNFDMHASIENSDAVDYVVNHVVNYVASYDVNYAAPRLKLRRKWG